MNCKTGEAGRHMCGSRAVARGCQLVGSSAGAPPHWQRQVRQLATLCLQRCQRHTGGQPREDYAPGWPLPESAAAWPGRERCWWWLASLAASLQSRCASLRLLAEGSRECSPFIGGRAQSALPPVAHRGSPSLPSYLRFDRVTSLHPCKATFNNITRQVTSTAPACAAVDLSSQPSFSDHDTGPWHEYPGRVSRAHLVRGQVESAIPRWAMHTA